MTRTLLMVGFCGTTLTAYHNRRVYSIVMYYAARDLHTSCHNLEKGDRIIPAPVITPHAVCCQQKIQITVAS